MGYYHATKPHNIEQRRYSQIDLGLDGACQHSCCRYLIINRLFQSQYYKILRAEISYTTTSALRVRSFFSLNDQFKLI